jgi:hypothetical protein
MEDFIAKQYEEFLDTETFETPHTADEIRQMIIDDLSVTSQMSVEEYTLYRKYQEIHIKYPSEQVNTLFGEEWQINDPNQARMIRDTRSKIWMPKSPEDYENLDIEMVYTDDMAKDRKTGMTGINVWNCVRTFTSTMINNSNIGRNLHFLIRDRASDSYLGVVCITGDFMDLGPRDDFIGWDREYKTHSGKLNNSCIGSTIVPLQPLGFNYTGGKLLALLCLSDDVQNIWEAKYGDKLVSVTTTSLYGKNKAGGLSQYDNLKHWKKMGYSSGSIAYELKKDVERAALNYFKVNDTEKYFLHYVAKRHDGMSYKRDHRNRYRNRMFSNLKIPKEIIRSDHERGIYYSPLYTNTREFLRGEIEQSQLVKSFDTSTEYLTDLWKQKYARKRIASLIKNERQNLDDTLFYDDICFMSWDECKDKYLSQVGR